MNNIDRCWLNFWIIISSLFLFLTIISVSHNLKNNYVTIKQYTNDIKRIQTSNLLSLKEINESIERIKIVYE